MLKLFSPVDSLVAQTSDPLSFSAHTKMPLKYSLMIWNRRLPWAALFCHFIFTCKLQLMSLQAPLRMGSTAPYWEASSSPLYHLPTPQESISGSTGVIWFQSCKLFIFTKPSRIGLHRAVSCIKLDVLSQQFHYGGPLIANQLLQYLQP